MTNTALTLVKGRFFQLHHQLRVSNTVFLDCVSKSRGVSLKSDLSALVAARDIDYLYLLRDHGMTYENTSYVIKILLTTQKSIETSYLICLNASQTDFNDAGFPRRISEYTPSACHGQVS